MTGHRDDLRRPERRTTRRAFLLFGGQFAVGGLLLGQMVRLQALESNRYRTIANDNRVSQQILAPERGILVDRHGVALAINSPNYRVLIVRELASDPARTLASLARLIPLSRPRIANVLRKLRESRTFVPVLVEEHLDWEAFSRININAPALRGLIGEVGWSRAYPKGARYGHLLGYVAAPSDADIRRNPDLAPLLRMPGFKIGKRGLERGAEAMLRGKAGVRRVEVNAHGRIVREIDRSDPEQGKRLELTIDDRLQSYAVRRLGDKGASCAVIDVRNGDILVLCSHPSFDPNLFVDGISSRSWDALLTHERRPLLDKSIAGLYPPGSTFKMIVALAAMEAGILPGRTTDCPGYFELKEQNQRFHCWESEGHGELDMVNAIAQSCDVYFYELAQMLDIERIAAMARRFGLGEAADIGVPSVKGGLVPGPEWKRARTGEIWLPGDTLNTAIGQGFMLASPLQLAIMTARIASGGRAVTPRLVRAVDGVAQPVPEMPDMGIPPEFLDVIMEGMDRVVNTEDGTAFGARIGGRRFRMAGKTGTAQVRRITQAERALRESQGEGSRIPEYLPRKYRDHALFVACAPADAPRYAAAVIVEHGVSGSRIAAPIARDLMMTAQGRRPYVADPG